MLVDFFFFEPYRSRFFTFISINLYIARFLFSRLRDFLKTWADAAILDRLFVVFEEHKELASLAELNKKGKKK